MNKQQKLEVIEQLTEDFKNAQYFYLIDESNLNAAKTSELRRACFAQGISYTVVKNTLIKKALEASKKGSDSLYETLHGPTAVFFSSNATSIAKLIKEFRADDEKPSLKAAYIDSDVFIGDDQLTTLSKLKSKEDLLGEIIGMLQSPINKVISGLQSSGGSKIAGLLKSIEEKAS